MVNSTPYYAFVSYDSTCASPGKNIVSYSWEGVTYSWDSVTDTMPNPLTLQTGEDYRAYAIFAQTANYNYSLLIAAIKTASGNPSL